ncbi:CRISPR-associated endonuclease Cas2 [Methanosalsum natronophilum]|uniref:CRISPR-associated endoribonuclease Cas2 n=1 Tax=Methanosalsum natronophilum TaxID=768733 RepID=A0A424Z4S2_9EURY|nr:MAG: CRISPR-associated endonuclease Cas2 [Methanosalsum natronophilum]
MTMIWVIYDIVDDKVRNKVARLCLNKGLYRVQKSVFLGDINSNLRDTLALECEAVIDPNVDSVYIFPMDSASFKQVKLLGQAFDKELVSDEVLTQFF